MPCQGKAVVLRGFTVHIEVTNARNLDVLRSDYSDVLFR
jgi:hypothetical protein